MRLLQSLAAGLVLATVIMAGSTYASIPARPAVDWFGLPALSVAVFAALQVIAALLPGRPHLFNFPEKHRFLAIPRAYHGPVIAEMRAMLDLICLTLALSLLALQYARILRATGRPLGILAVAHEFVILLVPFALLWLSRLSDAVDAAERRWKAERDAGA